MRQSQALFSRVFCGKLPPILMPRGSVGEARCGSRRGGELPGVARRDVEAVEGLAVAVQGHRAVAEVEGGGQMDPLAPGQHLLPVGGGREGLGGAAVEATAERDELQLAVHLDEFEQRAYGVPVTGAGEHPGESDRSVAVGGVGGVGVEGGVVARHLEPAHDGGGLGAVEGAEGTDPGLVPSTRFPVVVARRGGVLLAHLEGGRAAPVRLVVHAHGGAAVDERERGAGASDVPLPGGIGGIGVPEVVGGHGPGAQRAVSRGAVGLRGDRVGGAARLRGKRGGGEDGDRGEGHGGECGTSGPAGVPGGSGAPGAWFEPGADGGPGDRGTSGAGQSHTASERQRRGCRPGFSRPAESAFVTCGHHVTPSPQP